MKRAWASSLIALSAALVACRQEPAPPAVPPPATSHELTAPALWSDAWLEREGQRFREDLAYRRAATVASLVNPENAYSQQRLGAYALGDRGWDLLPAWNPRSRPVTGAVAAAVGRGERVELPAAPLWNGATPTTMDAWVALGRRVFFEYPMRAEVVMEWALAHPEVTAKVGLERAADGSYPGLVAFRDVDGATRVGITCASCHTAVRDGVIVEGAARRRFDYGRLRVAYFAETGAFVEPELTQRMAHWGPGRADVTEDNDEDPVAIPDLFGLRAEAYLTQAGTLRHDSPLALAIRQDTQLTQSNHQRVRPPRELAWALAMYLYSLAPPPRAPSTSTVAEREHGARLFERACRGCHASAAFAGRAIDVAKIGTDPALATGHGRGTGTYRVAPLLDVARGAPYLHHGAVRSLDELLSPARLEPGYQDGLLGPGPIAGHAYGTELPAADRALLIAYLETL